MSAVARAAALAAVLASLASAPLAAQQTIGDLAARKVEVHKDTAASPNVGSAMENYKRFLELSNGQSPDEEFKARQRAKLLERELHK